MSTSKHMLPEVVEKHCGRINTDILSGWEKGIGPMRKVGGRLRDHYAPEHLNGQRYWDWKTGYDEGKRYKAIYMRKCVHFSGWNADGEVVIRRTGWSVPRGEIVTQMERKGCSGDVTVYYFNENGEIVRTVKCGI
ncbi:hypothetical protein ACWJKU_00385 (plasmid) [Methylocaldum sp. MU1018]|uniref:hypothetical protein n=1 Tax=Denitromonas sp. TaxID=2734609 RepID=UPI002AFEA2EC|nr:hypothetical protein [Denitromonas sp.]